MSENGNGSWRKKAEIKGRKSVPPRGFRLLPFDLCLLIFLSVSPD
jgi:hypothetical protein